MAMFSHIISNDISVLQSIICIGISLLVAICVRRRYLSPLGNIPGPFVASFTTSLWQLWHIFGGHTEAAIIQQHRKHGKFVRIGHNEVSVCDVSAIREILMSHMDKGSTYNIFRIPDRWSMPQMAVRDCKEHMRRATILTPGFSLSNLLKVEPYIDGSLRLLETRLDGLISQKRAIKFEDWFNYLAFDVVGEALFSQSFGFLEAGKDIGGTIANNVAIRIYVSVLGHFPWAHDLLFVNPLIEYFKIAPAIHVKDTCLAVIEARAKNEDVRNDILAQWRSQMVKHPDRLPEKDIIANAVGTLAAGSDTVAAVLQAFVYHMLHNAEMMGLLREELDAAALSTIPTYEETQRLPVLQACIKETYRFHTPVGFGLPRISPAEGVTICGRYFPPGIILSVNPWAIHDMTSIFGDDASRFNPRRWLDPEQTSKMNPFLISFGAGYNQCPGRHLAHLEISKTTALLIRDYDIELEDPSKEWKFESYFTVAPHDWPCLLRRRQEF